MLFLVKGKIETTQYMSTKRVAEDTIRLVDAENEHEAGEKFKKYFNDMTDEYAVYYWASVDEVSEVIS